MVGKGNFFISKKWRLPWAIWGLFGAELAFTIPALALFAIAQPDLYRTKLRQFGADHGWNSSPKIDLYNAANHLKLDTPPPWNELYVAPDIVDPDPALQNHGAPWYITRGCGAVSDKLLHGYCQQAQASLGVTVIMFVLFFLNFVLAVWSMVPTQAQKEKRAHQREEESELDMEENNFQYPPPPQSKKAKAWEHEMQQFNAPPTPGTSGGLKSPVTPRTFAFNKLGGNSGRDLPLRPN
ncbi:hypothetical protein FH972_023895 [Carpinus fangiana]|uniref:Uncharacterized protein n=1 Tax=Carpinus fangiana TaxID=176857 RepID=A0A5N6KWV2_9ROSI|nr:hypothetical protein FH972_023895 [Carpinus fangiana]